MKKITVLLITTFIFISNYSALTLEDKLDELIKDIDNLEKNRLDKIYPIGSIYETTTYSTAQEVANALGGTWEVYGSGKTLVGVDSSDDDFNTVNKTGGSASTTLTTANLPSHTHSIPALSGTAASAGAHTHTRGTMNITGSVTTRALDAANYNLIISGSGVFNVTYRSESTEILKASGVLKSPYYTNVLGFNAANNWTGSTSSNGAHTHTVTTTASTTGSSGSGTAFTNLQPYITVYMYKRVG